MKRQPLADGVLAGALLAAAVLVGRRRGVRPNPRAAVAGAVGTVAFEAVAGRHAHRVRSAWRRPAVRGGAVAGAFGTIGVGGRYAPAGTVGASVGALGAYLCLLVLVESGLVPPPEAWTGRSEHRGRISERCRRPAGRRRRSA